MSTRRLVIVVRADPVICGHSGEARNLAEVALTRGFDDVRLLTWPLPALQAAGLPLKPLDRLLPYSPGISVERPEPVGDYRVPDGRYLAGLVGRLVELLLDGVPTTCLSMYLAPHANVVVDAVAAVRAAGGPAPERTIAKVVGSDVTNVIANALRQHRFGAAVSTLATFLAHDEVVAVSEFTREQIVASAAEVDAHVGTHFAQACRERVVVSYPPIDTAAFLDLDEARVDAELTRRGLQRDGYVLFLSRVAPAKGVFDLVHAYRRSKAAERVHLVVAGTGPALPELRNLVGDDDRIHLLTDVDDDEKPLLLHASAAYALPTRPEPDFVETFGIALTEAMLAGGGPVITTLTGGTGEAVGDTALIVPAGDVSALAATLDHALLGLSPQERSAMAQRAREHALRFDRVRVFDALIAPAGPREVYLPDDRPLAGHP